MAEKIIIAELEINTNSLQVTNTKLIKQIADLRTAQKSLKKETGNLTNATDAQARTFIGNDVALKKLSGEYSNNKKVLAENTTGIKGLNNALLKENATINEAKKNNKELLNARNQVNTKTVEGKKAIDEINAKIDKNNKLIKDNSSNLQEQKIGFSNYEQGVINALNEVDIFGFNIGNLTKKGIEYIKHLKAQIAIQNASTKSVSFGSKALKKFKLALVNTGIGAIVVVLGSLVTYLTTTQSGINKVNKVLIPLKIIFQSLLGVVQKVGKAIFGAFSNPKDAIKSLWESIKTNLVNRVTAVGGIFKALGKIISSGFTDGYKDLANSSLQAVTGVEDVIGKTKKLANDTSKFFSQAYKRGQRIAEIQQQLSAGEADYIEKLAEGQKAFKQQNKIAEDTTKTLAERETAAKKAIDILRETNKVQRERNLLELELLQTKAESKDTSDKERAEIAQKIVELKKANDQQLEAETTAQNKLNTIHKEANTKAIAQARKKADMAIKESKTLLDIYIAEQGIKAKTLSEELKLAEDISTKKKAILSQELKAKKISQSEYKLAVLELDNALSEKEAEIAVDNASRELEIFKDNHQSKLDANTFFTEELLNQETTRLDAIAEKEKEYHKKRLDEGVINQQEYNDAINDVDEANRIAKEESQTERDEAIKEEEAIAFDAQRVLDEENYTNKFALQKARLKAETTQKIKAAKGDAAAIKKIKDDSAEEDKKIDKEYTKSKIASAGATFGIIADLLGKQSAAGKAFALAQALINTYQGITAGVALGYPMAVPAVAAATITGFKAVSNIASTKAEKGALFNVGGKRHSQGGTKFMGEDGTAFEAEEGELIGVMNRNASRLFMEFNNKHRESGMVRSNVFATGGIVQKQFSQSQSTNSKAIDTTAMKEAIYDGAKQGTSDANIIITESAIDGITTKQTQIQEITEAANN